MTYDSLKGMKGRSNINLSVKRNVQKESLKPVLMLKPILIKAPFFNGKLCMKNILKSNDPSC